MIRFQPSEFMKLLMPMTVAWYLSKRNLPPGLKHMVISLAIIITPFVLILKQPDLGTAMLILASGGFVLFVGGLRWRWIVGARCRRRCRSPWRCGSSSCTTTRNSGC